MYFFRLKCAVVIDIVCTRDRRLGIMFCLFYNLLTTFMVILTNINVLL